MVTTRQKVNFLKNTFEKVAWEQQKTVIGIDEVGRGCLAGPLVTAAVILPPYKTHPLLKDSKIMTPQERLIAFKWVKKYCFYGVGIVHNRIIDRHNIWQATLITMKKALINLLAKYPYKECLAHILVDAMPLNTQDTKYAGIPVLYFNKGESKSSSIAAASIVAKVTRDNLMNSLDRLFPGYHLADHKGYATKAHRQAIKVLNYSIIHRTSFLETILHESREIQQHLWDIIPHLEQE